MIRCTEGHFYDPTRHQACPWCAKPLDLGGPPALDATANKTVPLRAEAAAAAPPVVAGPPQGATRRVVHEQLGIDPVVGWLVCVEGPEKGKDYRLHTEKNFIGRATAMDISIADETISRDRHAAVTFEPKRRTFWLMPGDASGLVYLNGDVIYAPTEIVAGDRMELGRTTLMLVPLVGDSFRWE